MVMASRLSLQSLDKMMELAKVLFPRWLGGCYCLISQSLISFANRLSKRIEVLLWVFSGLLACIRQIVIWNELILVGWTGSLIQGRECGERSETY